MQRYFICAMLQSSHFNRILSAVRECKVLLDLNIGERQTDADGPLQVAFYVL